ncbi:ABC-type transport auxiliary lipoprotein family protein [Phenylobacterium immobile]|uniref:ABC-type transport auxiliary lipoprotein family protein n=1 Tax=Phenylobacterium immobile TaxID=21 RepID=UPI000AA69941|nr:ABC-type transport auxiliary lipoprotein family protein [Phenylobacterium immobile]
MTARLKTSAWALPLLCASALALSGCVSLLPKAKPATLYRFGQAAPAASVQPTPVTGHVVVFRAMGSFQRESAGDRLLTITGDKAAYVAQTRWVAPAVTLFDEALLTAFDRDGGPVRLLARGEAGKAAYALRIDVRNFETHYDQGEKAAPLVVVRARVALTNNDDRTLVAEQYLESQVRAGDNRVGAIVAAYDQAVTQMMTKLVSWANASAKPIP